MTGIFRQKNPGNIFVLFIFGILLKLPVLFNSAPPVIKPKDSYVYLQIINFFKPLAAIFPFIYVIIAYLLLFLQAYLITSFINNNRLMNKANFLPAMAYMLVTSLLPEFNVFSSAIIVSTLFITIFSILFSAHNQNITRNNIFNAGLILGIASLIFLPSLLFIIWVYIALAILRPFKLNEWVLLLTGLITPYYFFIIILYLTDNFQWQYLYNGFIIALHEGSYNIWHAIVVFLVLLPLLVGLYYIQKQSNRMLIHVRKAWNLLTIYLIICVIISFFNTGIGIENRVLILLPVAALHGYGYYNSEVKIYPKIMFWTFIAIIISSQIFSNMW
ncbi:MAG: DUF6427 family protein [Niabella sp.]